MPFRKLFLTDFGAPAKVEQCNMDGSNRSRIVENHTDRPTALTLDLVRKLVYWADVHLEYIAVVDYNGRNRRTVIQGSFVSIALHVNYCRCCFSIVCMRKAKRNS